MKFDEINRLGKNQDYWKKRAIKLELLTGQAVERTGQAVSRIYQRAIQSILAQIAKIYTRYAQGHRLTNEQANQLLGVKQTADCRQQLLQTYHLETDPKRKEELRAMLDAPAYANRISRLQALRDQVYLEARKAGLEEVKLVEDALSGVTEESYYRTYFDLYQGTGREIDFTRIEHPQVQAMLAQEWEGENYSSRIWNNNKAFAEQVRDTVTVGILSGQSYQEMAVRLGYVAGADEPKPPDIQNVTIAEAEAALKELDKSKEMKSSPNEPEKSAEPQKPHAKPNSGTRSGASANSMRLIRTEMCRAASAGQLLSLQRAGLTEYRYVATLDLLTSKVCRALDGKIFKVAEAQTGLNCPPMHPNCRSVICAVLSQDFLAKIDRAARDPITGETVYVRGDMTYQEWYDKYVKEDKQETSKRSGEKFVANPGESGILDEKGQRAIYDYMSSNKSYPLNDALRRGTRLTADQRSLVHDLDEALEQLPDYQGTVYRSLSAEMLDVDMETFLRAHQPFSTVRYDAYTSTGKVVYDSSMEIQMVIQSKHGKDISRWNSGEQEVLFRRKSSFFVTKVEGNTIYMEEAQ
jgi:SPP1 gp7 family putative phage head morphogenesis protein